MNKALLLGFLAVAVGIPAMANDYNSQYMQRRLGRLPGTEQKVVDSQKASSASRAVPAKAKAETYDQRYRSRRLGR